MKVKILLLFVLIYNITYTQCIVDIAPTPQLSGCIKSVSPVIWTDAVNVNINGNSIDRINSNGWNCGAASTHKVRNNMFFSTIVGETNRHRMVGLSTTNVNAHFNTIDYAFYMRSNGNLRIYESGAYIGSYGNYATGDELIIAVENNIINYYHNNNLVRTSSVAPVLPLIVDASIYHDNGTVQNANIGTYVGNSFECQTYNMGVSLIYQWKLNGNNIGTNSNVYINGTITNTDVITCEVNAGGSFCGGATIVSNVLNFEYNISNDMSAEVHPNILSNGCIRMEKEVSWTSGLNVDIINNSLKRASGNGWNSSGAVAATDVLDNMFASTIVNETNRSRMFGLSDVNTNNHYNTIDYALYLNSNSLLYVFESGAYRGVFGNYDSGDTVSVRANNGVIEYYKNSQLLYTSNIAPTFPLLIDVSLYHNNATIEKTSVGWYTGGNFTCVTNNLGVSPSFQWYLNTLPVGTNSNTYVNNTLSNNDSVYCIVTPDYIGCGSNSDIKTTTVKLYTETSPGMVANIEPVFLPSGCKRISIPVKWTELDDVVVSVNSIDKPGGNGWNAGAFSLNGISNNSYLTATVTNVSTYKMIGLSNVNTNSNFNTIDYALYSHANGNAYVYESGANRGLVGTLAIGDELSIGIEANVVKYFINGTEVFVSLVTPTLPLYADCSLYSTNANFSNVNFEGYVDDQFSCIGTGLGVGATYQWLLNGVAVGTNSNVYTNSNISNGDILSCEVMPSFSNCSGSVVSTQLASFTEELSDDILISVNPLPIVSGCLKAESPIVWVDPVNVNEVGNSITRASGNGWGTSGAASLNLVQDNMYIYTVANETNKYRMIGLSNTNVNAHYNTIEYAIYLRTGGGINVFESGANRGGFGNYSTGDTLKISVDNGVVKYYKNSTVFYASLIVPTLPMVVDASIYSVNGTLEEVTVGGFVLDTYTCDLVNAGVNPTYQWFLNGTPVGSNSNTYVNGATVQNDSIWCEVTPGISNCLNSSFASNKVYLEGANYDITTWTGVSNNDWLIASNWSNGIPNDNKSALIPNGLSVYPVINSDVYCQNLTIESGASVDQVLEDTLSVKGTWKNYGTYNSNEGVLKITPSCGSTISFYNQSPTSFSQLIVEEGASLELSGAMVSVHKKLALEDGSLNTNDLLRMVSDADGTARITEIKNGVLTGNVEVERYIDAGATNWRFLTLSVSGQDLEAFDDDFTTSGFAGTDFPNFPNPTNPFISFFKYSESLGTNFGDGFVTPISTSEPVNMGEGWWIWCGDSLQGTNEFVIDANGPIYQGDLDLPVTYTPASGTANEDGWNMVANPYHCTVDWESSNWEKTNIDGAIFIWNPDLAQYASYVGGIGTNLGDNKIASSQAFWVHSSGPSPQLTIKESCKVDDDKTFIKKTNQQINLLRLKLSANNTSLSDETVIRIEENTTTYFDADFDALKFYSTDYLSVQIASVLNGNDYTINSVDKDSIESIDLKIVLPTSDICKVTATDISGLDEFSCVLLEDLITGDIIDLKTDSIYNFQQLGGDYSPRLRIHFSKKTIVNVVNNSCYNSADGELMIESGSSNSQSYMWLDFSGDTISSSSNLIGLIDGTYFLTYHNMMASCGATIDSFEVLTPTQMSINSEIVHSLCAGCGNGEIDLTVVGGTSPYDYQWDISSNGTSSVVNGLLPGQYGVTILDFNGCDTTLSFEIGNVLSINSDEQVDKVSLYPNPTQNRLTIKGKEISADKMKCYNSLGQDISSNLYFNTLGHSKIEVSLADLPSGIYYFHIKNRIFSITKI